MRIAIEKFNLSFTQQDGRQILTLKAEVDGTEAQVDAQPPPRPATTFRGFRKLPVEIQDRVWELSFQEPRIFRLAEDKGKTWTPVVVPHLPPGSARACRRSRDLYERETSCVLGSSGGVYKSLRASTSRDIFYWDQDMTDDEIPDDQIRRYTPGIESFVNVAIV
ncbi:hypothetical protein FSPOR_7930 [Fusarium sporotrichioides]|uniref:2EXR domain-containing protein n=1 Tax=Fusarium sporotrichioides TaxID=5514 RepID=A0A395RX23_FUSSP|nr:hypothetical protein FSPOR_7930 [Fusarium sporotrichioides]